MRRLPLLEQFWWGWVEARQGKAQRWLVVGTVDGGREVWLCRGGGAAQFFHLILCFLWKLIWILFKGWWPDEIQELLKIQRKQRWKRLWNVRKKVEGEESRRQEEALGWGREGVTSEMVWKDSGWAECACVWKWGSSTRLTAGLWKCLTS